MDVRPAYRPPAAPTNHRHPTFVYWRRRIVLVVVTLVVVVAAYLVITLGVALLNQSYGPSYSARFAQWGRAHGLGEAVSWAQREDYRLHPPKVGGEPPRGSFGSGPIETAIPAGHHLPLPATLLSPAGVPLSGEGVWHAAGTKTASGLPTTYEAFVRPDTVHTSYVDAVVWMDPTFLRAQLYAGSLIPGGGTYFHAPPLRPSESTNLVAAFDAGLPLSSSQGGYYTQGRTVVPLRDDAASVVTYKDGTMDIVEWGRDVTLSNQVASVRQNLDLIVDKGRALNGLNRDKRGRWRSTLPTSDNIWRSGVGVTRNGALLYVAGPGLSLRDLANIFVLARAYRAMELNVGADWVQFSTFTAPRNAPVNATEGVRLLNGMGGAPSRYFASWWTHDFFTMTLRSDMAKLPAKKSS